LLLLPLPMEDPLAPPPSGEATTWGKGAMADQSTQRQPSQRGPERPSPRAPQPPLQPSRKFPTRLRRQIARRRSTSLAAAQKSNQFSRRVLPAGEASAAARMALRARRLLTRSPAAASSAAAVKACRRVWEIRSTGFKAIWVSSQASPRPKYPRTPQSKHSLSRVESSAQGVWVHKRRV